MKPSDFVFFAGIRLLLLTPNVNIICLKAFGLFGIGPIKACLLLRFLIVNFTCDMSSAHLRGG